MMKFKKRLITAANRTYFYFLLLMKLNKSLIDNVRLWPFYTNGKHWKVDAFSLIGWLCSPFNTAIFIATYSYNNIKRLVPLIWLYPNSTVCKCITYITDVTCSDTWQAYETTYYTQEVQYFKNAYCVDK